MATFLQWTLPMPVVAAPGASVTLPSILTNSFGSSPNGWDHFWVTYYPPSQLTAWDFSYWNLVNEAAASWYVNGADIGGGFDNQRFVPGGSIGTAVLHAGNDIGHYAYILVPTSGTPGSYAEYIQYSITTIDPHVLSPVAGHGEPTPQDIVATAYRFANFYGLVPNDNDCHNIAAAVATATGATLTDLTGSLDPTQNQEGGFWRIVYKGSDANPIQNWQALVHPGDIVRMGWTAGGQHTTTVLSVNADQSMVVYDNSDFVQGIESIGVHTAKYDQKTIPSTVTIYRLTFDGLYLENGTGLDETLPGTIFNDHVFGFGGNDDLSGGPGDDILVGGGGNDTIDGGPGIDSAVFSGQLSAYTLTTLSTISARVSGPNGTDT
jgi:Ca2+-binding RTX toxin-like protein